MSMYCPYHPSIHCVLCLSLHLSVHHILSIHQSDDKCQEFPDEFPGTNYGEKNLSKMMARIPDDVTLTLHQAKFPEETPGTTNGVKYPNFLAIQKWDIFMVVNLKNSVLGVFQVTLCTMRCVHGSIAKIFLEWDPGPTYLVKSLWDPGGPSYSSRSCVPMDLHKQGTLKSYLDYIHLPGLSSLPFLVILMLILAPNDHLGKFDHMVSFRYLPRLDQ